MRSLALLTAVVVATLGTSSAAPTATTAAAALPTVDLGYSIHQATINETGAYYNFSNIRYAAPPLGNLRFAAPIPPVGENRTLNDGQHGGICPQANPAWELIEAQYLTGVNVSTLAAGQANSTLSLSDIPKPGPTETEDCLLLDVIVPEAIYDRPNARVSRGELESSNSTETGAPVLVWIYGGGYVGGSKQGSGNPAGLIASSQVGNSTGLVFVAFNYRLGLFGWLSGPTFQENGTANVALHDQRLALEWVQQNIHLFGGDPNRVTVMGESAGGGSIMHQITAYGGLKGKVPFQQAILQSAAFANVPSANQQETTFNSVLSYASYVTNSTINSVSELRTLSSSVLQTVNAVAVGLASYGTFNFGPTVDGLFVPALPGQLLLHGQYDNSLKLLIGHNLNESLIFTSPFINSSASFNDLVTTNQPSAPASIVSYIEDVLYPPIFNGSYPYTSQNQRAQLVIAESTFTCNSRYLATAFNNQTYSYFFAVPPGFHGQDIAYTFFNGDTSTSDYGLPVNAKVAQTFQSYITNFAKSGDPNVKGQPFFPMYGANSTTLDITLQNSGTLQVDSVANARCAWWQKGLYY